MMDHIITLGGLFGTLAVLLGLGMAGVGLLGIFAGGMSDNTEAGNEATHSGCLLLLTGVGLAAWSLYLLFT